MTMTDHKVNKQKKTLEKEERLRRDLSAHRETLFIGEYDEGQVL